MAIGPHLLNRDGQKQHEMARCDCSLLYFWAISIQKEMARAGLKWPRAIGQALISHTVLALRSVAYTIPGILLYSRYTDTVTHPSTNLGERCLTC